MKLLRLLFLLTSPILFAQIPSVDFKTVHAAIEVNPVKRNVVGNGIYTFEIGDQKPDTIRIDAQKMEFTDVKINGSKVAFKNNKKQLLLYEGFRKGSNTLTFNYDAFPTQTMYFVNWDFTEEIDTPEEVNGQIWTQGQGKYTSHWLPSFDDVNEKAIFSLDVTFQKSFEVISNGVLAGKKSSGENNTWQFRMKQPMSSYLVMLAIGHFDKRQNTAASGVALYNYYELADAKYYDWTYKNSNEIFDFLEAEIGVPYPWEVYRQVPVRDFLYAGMENTSATIFSHDYVVDAIGYNDRTYQNVNAHELAHQWFGDMVTAQSGKHHWLQEGFATYYALLAEQKIFGDNYFYEKLLGTAQQLKAAAKTDSIPLLNEKASALSYYQKGAWALHIIRSEIGREKFNLAIKNYLEKYAFKTVVTDDFLAEVAKVSKFDNAAFKKKWLEGKGFPIADAETLLVKQSEFAKQFIDLRDHPISVLKAKGKIVDLMNSDVYYPVKELLLYQIVEQPFEVKQPVLLAGLKTKDWNVRKAVAATVETIPESFRADYETLLNDESYETQEIALFNLWKIFPDQRQRYIELSKNWIGFDNKNLRLLHLSLAYKTTDDKAERFKIYQELIAYTGTNYDSGLQLAALEKLLALDLKTEDVLRSLAYATGNHRWQLVKFAKDNIRILLKEKKYRDIFIKIRSELPIREKTQLQRLLEEK